MSKYIIEITETLKRQIDVEAEDYFEAVDKAEEIYKKQEVILTADDFYDVQFEEPIGCDIARQIHKRNNQVK
jgi:hypothetical protein